METQPPPWTLSQIAEWVGGVLAGPGDLRIERLVQAGSDDPQGLTFAESADYLAKIEASGVGAALVRADAAPNKPCVKVADPRIAFLELLGRCERPLPLDAGVHPSAVVHEDAAVDPTASIGAYCVIERGACVGAGARIHPLCYVGENCLVGEGCELLPRVVLYRDVSLGARTLVHSGAVLGADGFGFFWDGSQRVKIPQVGSVVVGPDVEIGANTTVDRATMGETVIGEGTKLDNLVQVAHNVRIGEHGVIAGLTGIAGSTALGDRITVGGGVGFRDHITIGDDVTIGGRSAVGGDLPDPGEYFGTPAMPKREAIKCFLLFPKLPELYSRIKELEKKVAELAAENGGKD